MIYVALLRGINVGGNNKINMKQLKETFEQAGMQDVVTYINTGNIIFADHQERIQANAEISRILEQAITAEFGLEIRVVVRNMEEMQTVLQALPEEWTNDEQAKSDVMFLWDEVNDVSVLDKLPLKPEVGTLIYVTGAILYSVSREDAARSGMNKLVGSSVYKYMTVRNVNTTRQIYKLMLAAAE
ncbi:MULTISPECIES: DUF1697 domain-containing protein [Paenibacillus]|uniref:DUF1697 domain-containing protein n=1 Tax=Paenibacillus illinoisensis TaxID=59845 RepID=A0A2W0C3Z5_9BACL|nr:MULTISPECIES: DUF1697 domain-containing protein [Paenibacillus]MBM6385044.1 DUF1697 domain-containing protein [Paenibacillus sp.]PAD30947.1 hypothetical protein CHH60_13475 [Paenibacillus sp. 7523-1]PYY26930.1 Uncharacterized protein PIL02S_05106 [Paenibacillus illinoisensis]